MKTNTNIPLPLHDPVWDEEMDTWLRWLPEGEESPGQEEENHEEKATATAMVRAL